MTTRPHHIDIVDPAAPVVALPLAERARVQCEMIVDHAWLTGLPLESAVEDWVSGDLAAQFAAHYELEGAA